MVTPTTGEGVAAPAEEQPVSVVDVGVALAGVTIGVPVRVTTTVARGLVGRTRKVAAPVVDVLVLHPPLVPGRLQPGTVLVRLSRRGRRERTAMRERLDRELDALVPRVTDELVRRLDLDAIVTRLDLARLAQTVIVEVDLPEIIRESTSAVSSGAVREVRMRGISGDDSVGRVVDRLLMRRRRADVTP